MRQCEIAAELSRVYSLEIDAAHAYHAARNLLFPGPVNDELKPFELEHQRHGLVLLDAFLRLGLTPPDHEPDVKGMVIAALTLPDRRLTLPRGRAEAPRVDGAGAGEEDLGGLAGSTVDDARAISSSGADNPPGMPPHRGDPAELGGSGCQWSNEARSLTRSACHSERPTRPEEIPMKKLAAALGAVLLASSPGAEEIQRGHTTVDGVRLYHEVRGSGPPVVLLHGGIGNIELTYSKVLPDLARKYKVVAIEQVGHGRTADSDRPFSYGRMAEDTAAVLGKLGLGRVDLIGWSDGGIVALLVAAKHPELVRRVVVAGANTRLDGVPPSTVKWLRDSTAEALVKALPKDFEEAYARISPDGPAHWPVVVAKARDLWLTPVNVEKNELAAIEAPVLVVAGDQDRFTTAEHSVEIFRSLRRGQLWIVPGTGHDAFSSRPAWLVAGITEFLDAPDKK